MTLLSRPIRHVLAAALALAAAPAFAQDSPYSQTVFFGDSLTDSRLLPAGADAGGGPSGALIGRFTTNPGPGLVGIPGRLLRHQCRAQRQWPGRRQLRRRRRARRASTPSAASARFRRCRPRSNNYLAANGGKADPNALYTVWGGANDLFAVAADPSQAQAIIGGAVTAQVGIVGTLQAAGAQYMLVPTIPDIGLTPSSRAGGAVGMGQGTALATAYNDALFGGLAGAGLHVIPVDTFHFLQEVVGQSVGCTASST